MAFYDQLTGMPNKAMFLGCLEDAVAQASKENHSLGLLLLDLDGFGAITGRFGQQAGEVLLNAVAERLRFAIRETDMAAYFGGDTFAVLLAPTKGMDSVALAAERIKKKLGAPVILKEDAECSVGVSIGIAVYPDNGSEPDRLYTVADSAMYESKTSGKNTCTVFKGLTHERAEVLPWIALDEEHVVGIPEIDEQHQKLAELINELHEAIKGSSKKDRQHMTSMYDELISFTEFHFATEARLMGDIGYPQMDMHKREHKFLLDELRYFKGRIIEGGEIQAFQLLKDWLVAHIVKDDKPMGLFLHSKQ